MWWQKRDSPWTLKKLMEWCNERLARFKVPAEFVFVHDLPYTGNNRIEPGGRTEDGRPPVSALRLRIEARHV